MLKFDRRKIVHRYENNPIIKPVDLPYPCNSVFNCGVTKYKDEYIILFRVEAQNGVSHIGLARSKDGLSDFTFSPQPVISPSPDHPEEVRGVEDPRITLIDDTYWITYTGYSELGPLVCLASTRDFIEYKKHGIIALPENKDLVLFPEKFNGRYAMLSRPVPQMDPGPHIWISFSPDLLHWGEHKSIMKVGPAAGWESQKIGAGAPPFKTERGWVEIYHGVKGSVNTDIYRLGVCMFDLKDPTKVIGRSPIPILSPEDYCERTGDVPNAVFSCGVTYDEDSGEVRIYYGTADTNIGVARVDINDLFKLME